MKRIIDQLERSKSVFVASHINPDGDAVGSLVAMALFLSSQNKDVIMYNESQIPAVYRFLSGVDKIVSQTDDPDKFDTAVILDCGSLGRIGKIASAFERTKAVIINIDHHITNKGFGNLTLIDTNACSTAEIVYRLITQMEGKISKEIAQAIYTGILTDTGSFRFANTNRAAFSICEKMIKKGVVPYTVAKNVYGTYSLGRLKLLNLAIDSIKISENGKLSFMTLTHDMLEKTGAQPEDVEGMINYANRIEDVKVAVLIQEFDNSGNGNKGKKKFHVSLRSDGTVNVADLAAAFGGGGHHRAAGFNTEAGLSELKNGILKWLEDAKPELCGK